MAKYRCAILDDFQYVALKVADWSKISGDVETKVFTEHLGSADNVVKALQGFQIVVAMRERTALPRAISIEALRMPVVIRSLSCGSFSMTARGKPVRSRMATTIS